MYGTIYLLATVNPLTNYRTLVFFFAPLVSSEVLNFNVFFLVQKYFWLRNYFLVCRKRQAVLKNKYTVIASTKME